MRDPSSVETRNSLLQLSRRGQQDSSNAADGEGTDHASSLVDAAPVDLEAQQSVITQVTSRDLQRQPAVPAVPRGFLPAGQAPGEKIETRTTWKNKIRSLLCCLAPPANDQYYRSTESDAVVIRPPQPPTPPRFTGEAVIGLAREEDRGRKTLVLDLDETLVHSSFKPVPNPDYIIPVEIEGKVVDVYVIKRPWLDHFMAAVGARFEVVVFTASLRKYADPLLDLLDGSHVVRWRLFRESCYPYEGNYVKDLCCLGRELAATIIVDNSPHSYVFQPDNAVPIGTFIDDPEDQELLDILPVLMSAADEKVADVRQHLGPQITALHNGKLQPHVVV